MRTTQLKIKRERKVGRHAQDPDAPKLESLIGTRIEYLSSIEMDKAGSETNVLCIGGTV